MDDRSAGLLLTFFFLSYSRDADRIAAYRTLIHYMKQLGQFLFWASKRAVRLTETMLTQKAKKVAI